MTLSAICNEKLIKETRENHRKFLKAANSLLYAITFLANGENNKM